MPNSLDYSKKRILAKILNQKVEQILSVKITDLTIEQKTQYETKIQQLEQGIPLDYILCEVRIGELNLELNSKTLIPRPETEEWIEKLKKIFSQNILNNSNKTDILNSFENRINIYDKTMNILEQNSVIARNESDVAIPWNSRKNSKAPKTLVDLGCGSGLIGLSLAKLFELIILIDIEPECLRISESNAKNNHISNYKILLSDVLKSLDKNLDNWILISNPPYLPRSDFNLKIQNKIQYEPSLALYSGVDGLELFGKIVQSLKNFKNPPTAMYFELDPRNAHSAEELLKKHSPQYKTTVTKDMNGLDRFLECEMD